MLCVNKTCYLSRHSTMLLAVIDNNGIGHSRLITALRLYGWVGGKDWSQIWSDVTEYVSDIFVSNNNNNNNNNNIKVVGSRSRSQEQKVQHSNTPAM